MCHAPGVQVVARVPWAGPVPPPSMVVIRRMQGLFDLLRADEVDVAVKPTGRDDLALAGNRFGARANDDVRRRTGCPGCLPCRPWQMRPSSNPISAL